MQVRSFPAERVRAAAGQAADRLASDPRIRLVYCFGSASDSTQPAVRDLDLAILAAPPLSDDELMRLRADLVLATGVPIDLIQLHRAPVVLAHEVVEHGRCLLARPPGAETDFVVRTRARYWDFKPFRDAQWRLAGERLEERRRGTPR
jgi:uncharacterized protein